MAYKRKISHYHTILSFIIYFFNVVKRIWVINPLIMYVDAKDTIILKEAPSLMFTHL